MNGFLLLILVPLLIIAGMAVLIVIGMMVTSPAFWVILVIGIIVLFVFSFLTQKSKGYLSAVKGNVSCKDVDASKVSVVYLYPDKVTVNDIQTIPIERVDRAFITVYDDSFVHRGHKITRKRYSLSIHYKTKEGSTSVLTCKTKENPFDGGDSFKQMEKTINQLVGYEESVHKPPTKPYEL